MELVRELRQHLVDGPNLRAVSTLRAIILARLAAAQAAIEEKRKGAAKPAKKK